MAPTISVPEPTVESSAMISRSRCACHLGVGPTPARLSAGAARRRDTMLAVKLAPVVAGNFMLLWTTPHRVLFLLCLLLDAPSPESLPTWSPTSYRASLDLLGSAGLGPKLFLMLCFGVGWV